MNTVILLALAAAVAIGLGLALTQMGMRHLSPVRGACVAIPTTALFFLLLAPFTIDFGAAEPKASLLFAVSGLLFPAAVTLMNYGATRRIGPSMTGALGNLAPLCAVFVAFVLLGEIPRPSQLAAIAVILFGVALLFGNPFAAGAKAIDWAVSLPVIAALIRGIVQPVVKLGLATWPNPFAATLFAYVASAIVLVSVGFLLEGRKLYRFEGHGWLWLPFVGICNGIGLLLIYAALARGPVAVVAPIAACYPVPTMIFSRFFFGREKLAPRVGLGVIVTVAGVVLLLLA
ncbi:MAG TPA: EamA family transporter [Xanthobacteraceae bacterium]|nr:EamA family transporter [Xanthobacteraceae bacterium]